MKKRIALTITIALILASTVALGRINSNTAGRQCSA